MRYTFALCASDDNTPAEKTIFQEIKYPFDFVDLLGAANAAIPKDATEVVLYSAKSIQGLLAVIAVCGVRAIDFTFMHYNQVTDSYEPQYVLSYLENWGREQKELNHLFHFSIGTQICPRIKR